MSPPKAKLPSEVNVHYVKRQTQLLYSAGTQTDLTPPTCDLTPPTRGGPSPDARNSAPYTVAVDDSDAQLLRRLSRVDFYPATAGQNLGPAPSAAVSSNHAPSTASSSNHAASGGLSRTASSAGYASSPLGRAPSSASNHAPSMLHRSPSNASHASRHQRRSLAPTTSTHYHYAAPARPTTGLYARPSANETPGVAAPTARDHAPLRHANTCSQLLHPPPPSSTTPLSGGSLSGEIPNEHRMKISHRHQVIMLIGLNCQFTINS